MPTSASVWIAMVRHRLSSFIGVVRSDRRSAPRNGGETKHDKWPAPRRRGEEGCQPLSWHPSTRVGTLPPELASFHPIWVPRRPDGVIILPTPSLVQDAIA